ncbi:MAG: TPM domain-containing protein, partial [bacterium]
MSPARIVGWCWVVGVLALAPLPAHAIAGDTPIPEARGYVNDRAGVLAPERAAQLEGFLDQVQKRTGVQFAVLVVTDCAPDAPSVFKTRVFEAWGIGSRERNDGLLLLVAMQERDIVFETGYGLEGTL